MSEIDDSFLNDPLFIRWRDICRDNGIDHCTPADVDHSALLGWLRAGKEPFPEPPPRSHSYPWYSLIETGRGEPLEVWEPKPGMFGPESRLVVDQSASWIVKEKLGEEKWLATYLIVNVDAVRKYRAEHGGERPADPLPQREASGLWLIQRNGVRKGCKETDALGKLWRIELSSENR